MIPRLHQFREDDPTDAGLFWVLVLGRIIGVVPLSISWKPVRSVAFRWCSLSALHTFTLTILSVIVQFPQIHGGMKKFGSHTNILDELEEIEEPFFQLSLTTTFIFFTKNSHKLVNILRQISFTFRDLNLKSRDPTFPRFCATLAFALLSLGVIENALWHIFAIQIKELGDKPTLEKLYFVESIYIRDILPGNCIIHLAFFYLKKIGSYTWNYGDVFLIILCRAVSHKFSEINEEIQSTIDEMEDANFKFMEMSQNSTLTVFHLGASNYTRKRSLFPKRTHLTWEMIRLKVIKLCKLGEIVGDFVNPLVLACYGYNIFFVILNNLRFLYDPTWESDKSVYVYVSILQFSMRVVLVTYYAAQLNHSTDAIVKTLEYCPDSCFSETAARLERMLRHHPVGVTIFGSLRITNTFFVSILSFMFTTEIVLLQAMSAAQLWLRNNNNNMTMTH